MNKKLIIAIIIIILALATGFGVFFKAKKSKQSAKSQSTSGQNQENQIDTSNWKTYRDEKFGFEVKYPTEWKLIIKNSNPNDLSKKDSFIFQKKERTFFAVFTNGGFGHDIQNPERITYDDFKEKQAKMYWYNYSFPNYITITDNLPKNWREENVLEIMISDNDPKTIEEFQDIYESFQFIH